MIKTTNLNKYYLKGKENEIHVINDCNLELPDTGLVTILGESGSGKTTLLNVIGGLDRAKGTIDYDGHKFNNYKMNSIDKYRRENFGFIFQNYNILPELSIIENLSLALEIVGIIDKEEQEKRIKIALNAVGLYKFRKKPAGKLSGGQMQRVAIARALVKKCKVLIADEPTGNLDSTNSIEIMNILKKISETTLVLLVTHDKQLAEFYSTKIIELTDGKITNIRDANNNISLQNKEENKVYLKDLNQVVVDDNGIKTVAFSEGELPNIDITLVEKNGTFYIKSNVKIKALDDSNLELINDHFHETTVDEYKDRLNYDTLSFDDSCKSKNYKRIFFLILDGFRSFFKAKKRTKAFRFVFILLGVILGYMAVLTTQYIKRDYSNALSDSDVYSLKYDKENDKPTINDKIIDAYNEGIIETINVDDCYAFSDHKDSYNFIYQKNYYQTITYSGSIFQISYATAKKYGLASGREPKNSNEIIIGKKLANSIKKKMKLKSYQDIINSVSLEDSSARIVGVSNKNTNTLYFYDEESISAGFSYIISKDLKDFYLFQNDYSLNVRYENNFSYTTRYGRELTKDDKDSVYIVIPNNSYPVDMYGKYPESVIDDIIDDLEFYNGDLYKDEETDELMHSINSHNYHVVGLGSIDNYQDFRATVVTNEVDYFKNVGYDKQKYFSNVKAFSSFEDSCLLVEGEKPTKRGQCVVPIFYGLNIGDKVSYSGDTNVTYEVCGIVVPLGINNNMNYYNQVYTSDIEAKLFSAYRSFNQGYYITTNDVKKLESKLGDDLAYELFNVRNDMIKSIDKNAKKTNFQTLMTIFALLAVVLIYIYFTMRSKLIHDIYEIGVLRNIGASTKRIYSKYVVEIFITTLFTTFLGYFGFLIVYNYIYKKINKLAKLFGSYSVLETPYPYIGVLIIFLLNIIVGLIPVILLLRKTPKEISSKYDI